MKNRKELVILLKVILVMLIIILLLIVFFLYNALFNKKEVKENKKSIINNSITKRYSIDNINYIEIDFKNYEVIYLPTKEKELIVKQNGKANKFYVEKEVKNSKLIIKEKVSNIFEKKNYRIYIPESYINSITIINGFSNIKISDLNNIIINNNAGNVSINNVRSININNVSGNIYIKGRVNSLIGTSSTGDINIDNIVGNIYLDSITGDITVKNLNILSKSKIETTSGNINVKIDKKSNCLLKYDTKKDYYINNKKCLNGENELKIKNVTGNVNIN